MRIARRFVAALAALGSSLLVCAQQAPAAPEGVTIGNYNVRQTFEFGWRSVELGGSQPAYDTFVDLHNGARLLEQTMEVRSLNHNGAIFDSLSFAGFGYGGDPNTSLRFRVDKDRWYTLTSTVRRSRNVWNYDLFANPLNPATSNPNIPVNSSPHALDLVRRMSGTQLKLLPQSRVSLRLGYDRNVMEGPASTTFHPTDLPSAEFLLFLPWETKQETYRAGIDFKLLPRTTISYDQFFERLQDGRSASEQIFGFQLPNGVPYNLGLTFNTVGFEPCNKPIVNAGTTPPTVSPNCVGTSQFNRKEQYHATYPTEQVTLQSNFFRNIDVSGRMSYSTAQMRMPNFTDIFTGFLPSTVQQSFTDTANASAHRTAVTGDLAMTWAATEGLQFTNIARYAKFRIPGQGDFSESSLFALSATATPNTLATCKPPFTTLNCPVHTPNSPADSFSDVFGSLLAQTEFSDQTEARYEFRHAGARVGYRYNQRHIDESATIIASELFIPLVPNRGDCRGVKLQPDGTCQVVGTTTPLAGDFPIHEHTALVGAWASPFDALRLNVDGEVASADNAFTRMDPRRSDRWNGRASFRPRPWMELSATANRNDAANGAIGVDSAQHHRGYGFAAVVSHKDAFSLLANYDYARDDFHAIICFVYQNTPTGAQQCPGVLLGGYLQAKAFYSESLHYGSFALRWHPVKRVTGTVGYNVSRGTGSVLLLNPNAPPGPIDYTWQRPSASLMVGLTRRISWRAAWGYYGYDETGAAGPTLPRDFNANIGTVSLRYAF